MTTLDPTPAAPAIQLADGRAATLSAAKQELLQRRLRQAASSTGPAIPARPAGAVPPLSYAQERLWFMEQFAPGTAAYGVPLLIRLGSDADLSAFARALQHLLARHESLRMRFPSTADGQPTVAVDRPAEPSLPVTDVADESAVEPALQSAARRPFDLSAGPLLRAQVLRVSDGADHIVLIDMHHIVTDGWSNDLLLGELGRLYQAERCGRPVHLTAAVQYGDFAAWQREQMAAPSARVHVDYWLGQLASVPALELPTDAPRPPTQTFAGQSHHFLLPPDRVAALTALGRAHRATLFMTLLGAYQVLLSRYSGQIDFAIGSPVAGRSHPDLDGVIGMFVNMLPLRAGLAGDPTVAELVGRVRDTVLDALAHQDVPFEKVINELQVTRDVSRSPLFQAMFVLQNYGRSDQASQAGQAGPVDPDADLAWRPVELPATRFDLELHAYSTTDGGLQCRFVYNTELFTPPTAARLADGLQALLDDMIARPSARVSELELINPTERALVAAWNATGVPGRSSTTLPRLLAAQALSTADLIAVVDEQRQATYAELDQAANRVAHRLREGGIGPESVVAICAERSVELVIGLIGILKAGAAYLPLDPEYPSQRLAYMLADSGATVVLTQRRLLDRLPDDQRGALLLDDASQWAPVSGADPQVDLSPDAAAYLIYTSGSTGRPKGVVNTHRGVINRLDWMQATYQLAADDVVLQKTPASFDVSVWEFFWPLLCGARLVLARPGGHRDPSYLREAIGRHRVTTMHFVPSMLGAFLADAEAEASNAARSTDSGAVLADSCQSLRQIMCSGEELPAHLARQCLSAMPWVRLHNLYGPTEAAIDVTAWECTPPDLAERSRVPIGVPISNVRVHVLDRTRREVPVGAIGELHIGGVQVARGYHRRPGLTAQRFVADPFGPPGSRLYATGDQARWRPDGTVEYLGRIDGQIKLRGLRIELGEIEVALREQPGVSDAVAAIKEVNAGDKRIIGYVVGDATSDGGDVDPAMLREALRRRLPDYMVPAAFVTMPKLPLSLNGKVDRAALATPDLAGGPDRPYLAPATTVQQDIAEIWQGVLRIPQVSIDDDFFALGGHSLLATQVVAKLRRLTAGTGRQVGVMDLFRNPTVRGLAALVEDQSEARPRELLYELTKPVPAADRICSYVCVPYGGGSAVVYQPIADALPPGHTLYAVAIPGHDVGLDEQSLPFDELARRCTQEILRRVEGPLVLYGHCGVGGALIVELARLLEAAGRPLEAVYTGGVFPFAKPGGRLTRLHDWLEDRGSNRNHANWLKSMGVDMDELEPAQASRIITNMRRDSKEAERHFTELFNAQPAKLKAPIISVVGERDPITDYHQERYREWRFLTDAAAVVVLDEAGHFFLRYRAAELVDIITSVHQDLGRDDGRRPVVQAHGARWRTEAVSRAAGDVDGGTPAVPSLRRFAMVAVGQLVSVTGSSLTAWAIPVWLYLTTGSLLWFGLSGVMAVLPILVATPVAGAVADRFDRRRVIMGSAVAAATVEVIFALLVWRGNVALGLVYVAVWLISCAGTFQRVSFTAAVPQLVPKRYLGHANGVVQLINGVALLFVPLLAAGLLAAIGLPGILLLDIVSYVVAIGVLALVRFPDLMGRRRKETYREQLLGGARLTWRIPSFRAMLIFYGIGNLLYAAPILLVTPLVLAFGTMGQVGQAAFAEGLGGLLGGLAVTIWGGPRTRRMAANIAAIGLSGVFVMLTGARGNLAVILIGVFGTALTLAVANGIYLTIIQIKVPQRFHGRVIALGQTITWSTLPIGFALLVPAAGAFDPLLAPHGSLAATVGKVIGTGPGRGLGFAFVVLGFGMLLNALAALGIRRLARLDTEVPDALPDDLIGLQALEAPAQPSLLSAGVGGRGR